MERKYQQSWRDIQVKLEQKLEERLKHDRVNTCPDCRNKLYFLEGGFLCPVCGFSTETVYTDIS